MVITYPFAVLVYSRRTFSPDRLGSPSLSRLPLRTVLISCFLHNWLGPSRSDRPPQYSDTAAASGSNRSSLGFVFLLATLGFPLSGD